MAILSWILFVFPVILWMLWTCVEANITFKDYLVKARCQARCNGKYGVQPRLGATEFFDVYPSFVCKGDPTNCSQCSIPCSKPHVDLKSCYNFCASVACNESCVFYYTTESDPNIAETRPDNGDSASGNSSLHLTQPVITCTYSYKGHSRQSDVHMSYLRWNVRDRLTNASTSVPLCFLVALQVESPDGVLSSWKLLGKTNFSFIPATKLEANSRFRFNVTAVGVLGPVDEAKVTNWVTMPPASSTPERPSRVEIVRQEVRHGKVSALVRWNPGHQGGCFFKLYWMGDGDMKDSFQARDVPEWPEFKYELTNLMFGRNYTVQVHTFNREYNANSNATSVRFETITCLDNTNYSYIICEPDPPRNLTTIVGAVYSDGQGRRVANVTLTWLKPIHVSRYNRIKKFAISWRKKPPFPYSERIEAHHGETSVSGVKLKERQTSLVLPDLHMDSIYVIAVKAVAGGGNTTATLMLELGTPYKNVLGVGGNASTAMNTRLVDRVDKNVYILALLPACLACLASLMYYLYRKYCRPKTSRQEKLSVAKQEVNPLYGSVEGALGCLETTPLIETDDYEIDPARLRFVETLGEGAFGKVMRAELEPVTHKRDSSSRTVAVKILKDHATSDERRSLLLEIEVMKQFGKHQNVVSMIGCCTTGLRICLVMDFCPLGDLRNYLREYREKHLCNGLFQVDLSMRQTKRPCQVNSDSGISQHSSQGQGEYGANGSRESRSTFASSLPSCDDRTDADVFIEENFINQSTLLSYARQIALGMEFLSQKKFVHRDLATRNILVHNHRLLKISDFGLSRDVYETNIYQPTSGRKLPYKWMPLESIFDHKFTTKSDVWSFGIVLWEIVTLGGCPYPGIPNRDLFSLLKEGYRMEKPDNCSHEIYQMMLSCWHPRPEDRPCFAELRFKLESLLEATRSYIDLTVNVSPDYYTQESSDERESDKVSIDKNKEAPNGLRESRESSSLEEGDQLNSTAVVHVEKAVSHANVSLDSESGTECSFQSQENSAENCGQEVISEYDLDPDTDSNCSEDSLGGRNTTKAYMKAPSLRNGMITLLGRMAKRGQAARLMNPKHSLSLSEVFNIGSEDEPTERVRTGSSGFLI